MDHKEPQKVFQEMIWLGSFERVCSLTMLQFLLLFYFD